MGLGDMERHEAEEQLGENRHCRGLPRARERVDLIVTHDEGFKATERYIKSATPEEMIQ